jgi:catechol 2,3-dioxygenase-like lactoylglutathione lyase family enzyme
VIRVKALDHVALGADDLDAVTGFYTEHWGLQLFDEADGRRYLRTRDSGHHALVLDSTAPAGLRHVGFEVSARADLDRAVEAAEAAGGRVEREPGDAVDPGHRASAALRDPDGNVVELVWAPERVGDPWEAPLITPRKVGHVVLNTPQPEAMEAFYGQLGFRASDRTARGMTFLRCNRDHHTLAFMKSGGRTGVQHVAYDVDVLDNVMRGLAYFTGHDIPCLWGPGRHGPGNNIFTYYADPGGTVVEYYAELEQVDDPDGEPLEERFWGPEWGGDVWGLAGPPPDSFRG